MNKKQEIYRNLTGKRRYRRKKRGKDRSGSLKLLIILVSTVFFRFTFHTLKSCDSSLYFGRLFGVTPYLVLVGPESAAEGIRFGPLGVF